MIDLLIYFLGLSVLIEMCFFLDFDFGLIDVNQFELFIINFVINVCDVMFNGGCIVFFVSNQWVLVDNFYCFVLGNYICLSISDIGSGMDEEILCCVVEFFYIIKGVGCGIGLGLLIVDGFVEQFGGWFILESQLGVGIIVNIWIFVVL